MNAQVTFVQCKDPVRSVHSIWTWSYWESSWQQSF